MVNLHHTPRQQGEAVMSKGENTRKEGKKAAVLSPKEKKAAKQIKKADKKFSTIPTH
jgi:hypothetical protein